MRIFVGIDLDAKIRSRVGRFLDGVQGFAPDARWARLESLHITLKFIGEQTREQVAAIAERLLKVDGNMFEISARGFGFFPTAESPRVFWIGVDGGAQLAALAGRVDVAVGELGIPREVRPFSPHLTLARGGVKSGSHKRLKGDGANSIFTALEKRLAAMGELDFGTTTACEFILYRSQLSPSGSKYTELQTYPLRAVDANASTI
jgi:2'-5' RNA ligase